MIWPVGGPVVSGFGWRWGRMHEGIDIAAGYGTPIQASRVGQRHLRRLDGRLRQPDHHRPRRRRSRPRTRHQSSFVVGGGPVVAGPDDRLRRLHRPLLRRRTSTSRCASTAPRSIRSATCSPRAREAPIFEAVRPYSFRAASLARSWLAALSSPDGAGRPPGGRSFSLSGARCRSGQVAPAAVEVEAVADEELVRHREADVADRQVVDEAPVRAVEERHRRERAPARAARAS